jgi:Ca2+-binding EF-hand superfamily protein
MAQQMQDLARAKHEKKMKAHHEREYRLAVAEMREAGMDMRAEQRRVAKERVLQNTQREEIRESLLIKAGSAREAFDVCDVSRSGKISLNELDGGLRGLGIRYQDLTGLKRIQEVFKLFDHDKKGYITFANLYPLDACSSTDTERMSTPEFWKYWCKQNKDVLATQNSSSPTARISRWEPSGPEEALDLLSKSRVRQDEVVQQKKLMRGMIHRLKHRGKSDARCREICAHHLPRGSGPREMQDVQTFSQADVSACRKAYTDKVQESVRNIEKTVFDMHDQRKKLHTSKQQLFACTEEPHLKHKAMEDARVSMIGLAGGGIFSKHHDEDE